MSDPGIELGDGGCDFEKVPPDQLCPKRGSRVHTANSADPCSCTRVGVRARYVFLTIDRVRVGVWG